MKRLSFVFFISLLCYEICAQNFEHRTVLIGKVLDMETGIPLTGVHLVNAQNGGTTSDIDGNFILKLSEGDTVIFTHIGYHDYLVPIPQGYSGYLELEIGLTPAVMELQELLIYQWPTTIAEFKQRLLATVVEEDEKVVIPGSYHGPPRPSKPGIGSPISFLQSKLSKKIRRRQEFLKKRAELENSKSARARYSAEYVHEITGIEDEKELEEFMEYCKFTNIWLADVNDYDLIIAINQCYKDFKLQRPD